MRLPLALVVVAALVVTSQAKLVDVSDFEGVTAEGVETEEQAAMVRAAGCDQIQGWLYFKAMPAAEIAQHLGKPVARQPKNSNQKDKVA